MPNVKIKNFYPLFEKILEEHSLTTAVVFSIIFRYCQFPSGKCTASQEAIGEKANISWRTVSRHARILIKSGYLTSKTIKGVGIEYYDTGKISMVIGADIKSEVEDKPRQKVSSTTDTKSVQPQTESQTNKDISNKDINKDTKTVFTPAELQLIALEGYPEYARAIVKPFIENTGIIPRKQDKAFWIKSSKTLLEIIGDNNVNQVMQLAFKDVGGLTISSPNSLIKIVTAIVGNLTKSRLHRGIEGPWRT